ncbi:hypothetical protein [Clostridium botulinum]|uniref:hypothetical protein n=1 Tax=Clostridium botulinum TaxID=1491 RepID=UPI001E33B983|nr:hypothetical protein [Clostridium botulinum]MCD3254370.1 hypothetical protein [Clostridium botulinum C/D]MCD3279870.1 hypothetical protein [Clostridium botulinum C/D]MCD3339601.1 hypothetical protein [Clostridium botulinum C/D]MCD3357509.1 hypothetical protein [Clostridium botulinum C/D]
MVYRVDLNKINLDKDDLKFREKLNKIIKEDLKEYFITHEANEIVKEMLCNLKLHEDETLVQAEEYVFGIRFSEKNEIFIFSEDIYKWNDNKQIFENLGMMNSDFYDTILYNGLRTMGWRIM